MADEKLDFERRLVEIESKASFQESELIDMSKIIRSQDTRIARLEATLHALIEKMKELGIRFTQVVFRRFCRWFLAPKRRRPSIQGLLRELAEPGGRTASLAGERTFG